ncbi:Ger(x)C family spore germination protein [Bacillus sp. AFS031507]|uniref:Ger(x)C family spore germination protein n=1 Tax=Bacillus sp. AFS031507 TaxID=2033496 RepID=UPI000BFCC0C9|nr:Ger(x)C family spore germination protein [Bacillus sp. AFS031507]PGY07760.1 hypothetical protein COE25_23140 [Bacillus sp. AFS031507]
MLKKSNITLYLAIGLIIALMVSKQVQDNTLNKISVISAIGIDKSKKGYFVTIQKYNPAASSKEGAAELGAYTYSAQGRTIPEAIDHIQNKFSRRIFLDSVGVVVLGESLVKSEGIAALSQYFLREPNFPSNIRFVISKGVKPDKLLQIVMPIQKVSGNRLEEMLNLKRESWGNLSDMTADKINGMLLQNRTELTIPYVTIIGRAAKGISKSNIEKASPDSIVVIEGLAVFQHQRFSYWLSSQESNLYALTRTKIYDTTLVTKCGKQTGYVTWKDTRSKSDIHLLDKKGVPSFLLQVKIKAEVSDVSCNIVPSTVQAIAQLEHDAEHDLQKQINHLIAKTQNKKTDIDRFGETLYRKQPFRWNRIKNNWDSVYPTVPIRIRVRVDLIEPGEISSQ